MSGLHFGIVAAVLAVLSFTQCRADDPVTTVAPANVIDPNFNCTQYGENQTLCCKQPSCAFVNCTVNNKTVTHEGCHNLNNETDKQAAAKACGVSETEIDKTNVCLAPDAGCNGLNQTECCGDQGFRLSCVFVNCTMKSETNYSAMCMAAGSEISTKCKPNTNHTVCIPHNSTTTTAAPTTAAPAKTTPAAINTTAVPISTTQAPTTPAATTSVPPTTTNVPTTTTKAHSSDKPGQHFDAASFIGGMILMGGLIVIIYFGLKFYRARRDRNYRTL